jgi:hypothetical protein
MPLVVEGTLTSVRSVPHTRLPSGQEESCCGRWPYHIVVIAYHLLLLRSCGYEELGGDYFDKRDRQAVERRLVRRLEGLGYKVSLDPVAA